MLIDVQDPEECYRAGWHDGRLVAVLALKAHTFDRTGGGVTASDKWFGAVAPTVDIAARYYDGKHRVGRTNECWLLMPVREVVGYFEPILRC